MARVENVERLMAKFARMTPRVRAAAKKMVDKNADMLVSQMRAIAPVDADGDHPGRLRDSIHKEEGRLGDVSAVVVVDAKDEQGRPYAARVELGHAAADGSQVPAEPFFYTTVRVNRKRIKRSIASAISRAVKAEANGGGGG
jgi:HK97 gp10 family phage protein